MREEQTTATTPGPPARQDEPHQAALQQLEGAGQRLGELSLQLKDFIRQHPGPVLLGAAAVGFLIGRWAARR